MESPETMSRAIRAVFFDIGETLVDETRLWRLWADWMRIPHATFFAALGAVIERRWHHRRVFDLLQPGFDLARETAARQAAGFPPDLLAREDFYPDALPCLERLRARGIRIGLAGNQPAAAEEVLREMRLDVDVVASSEQWGVEKPSIEFFNRVCDAVQLAPSEVAYVGDRLDNDVLPAIAAGMSGIFIRRGPWGTIHATWPEARRATSRIDSLDDLDALLT